MRMVKVFRYLTANGEELVTDWLQSIRDKEAQAKIRIRLNRLETGIFGDCKVVGDGVFELREHLGGGYRVYFGRHGLSVVILVCGISKRTQPTDIKAANGYWADWIRRHVSKKVVADVSHRDSETAELRADPVLAVAYLKAAMESLDNPDDRGVGLLALRTVAEAYGGLEEIAADAGITRESVYRSLSPRGNPTLTTLLAVLNALGMRLSVEQGGHRAA